jgi:hypothetical protein
MKSVLSTLLVSAVLVFSSGQARAQSAMETFGVTCRANPGFFDFAVSDLDAAGADQLCSCLSTQFDGYSDADLGMLGKDLDGSATPADRTAYGDYTGLEIKARDALNICLGAGPVPAMDKADMTKFDAACTGSAMLLQFMGDPEQAPAVRGEFCACLSIAVAPQVSTADADMLATDLDGTATETTRGGYPGYTQLANKAGAAFDSCHADLVQ